MTIATYHPEYSEHIDFWQRSDDVVNNRVHAKKQTYLPIIGLIPNGSGDDSTSNLNVFLTEKYNKQIWPMSVFYNFVNPTVEAVVGAIMRKPPTYKFAKDNADSVLDYLTDNADGRGNGLTQLARKMCAALEQKGRCGLLVDVPQLTNAADLQTGKVAPRLAFYEANQIIDWEVDYRNGVEVLTFLSLCESTYKRNNGVRENSERLINYHLDEEGNVYYEIMEDDQVLDTDYQMKDGAAAKTIPFHICGSITNDWSVDPSPTRTLTDLNLLHYKMMSRDYQARFDLGQVQWHVDLGASDNPVEDMQKLNPNGFIAGSASAAVTANGGKVTILQANEANLLSKTPGEIEDKAVKVGAQLLESGSSTETATAANIRASSSTSSMSSIASNAGDCIYNAIIDLVSYINGSVIKVDADEVEFSLNMDFFAVSLTAQDKLAYMNMVMQGVLPQSAMYQILRRNGDLAEDVTFDDYLNDLLESVGVGGLPSVAGE